tara:strand:+ start:814 stop:1410 length:597 start_codon:yes stop_codon:yes gene_type:complete
MNENAKFSERETWLTEGADQILSDIFPSTTKMPKYRVACGYPPRHRGGKVRGVCINASVSNDETFEVFINPSIEDGFEALDVLTHELVHVSDRNESGHKGNFVRIARMIGLEGKPTECKAGRILAKQLREIVERLGKYPHGSIGLDFSKKQSTRMLKVYCTDTMGCGFHFRTSTFQINKIDFDTATCPACYRCDLDIE